MNNELIARIRQLRGDGMNSVRVANMLDLALHDVMQAATEPDEDTLVDGERLEDRVRRVSRELRERHLAMKLINDSRLRG